MFQIQSTSNFLKAILLSSALHFKQREAKAMSRHTRGQSKRKHEKRLGFWCRWSEVNAFVRGNRIEFTVKNFELTQSLCAFLFWPLPNQIDRKTSSGSKCNIKSSILMHQVCPRHGINGLQSHVSQVWKQMWLLTNSLSSGECTKFWPEHTPKNECLDVCCLANPSSRRWQKENCKQIAVLCKFWCACCWNAWAKWCEFHHLTHQCLQSVSEQTWLETCPPKLESETELPPCSVKFCCHLVQNQTLLMAWPQTCMMCNADSSHLNWNNMCKKGVLELCKHPILLQLTWMMPSCWQFVMLFVFLCWNVSSCGNQCWTNSSGWQAHGVKGFEKLEMFQGILYEWKASWKTFESWCKNNNEWFGMAFPWHHQKCQFCARKLAHQCDPFCTKKLIFSVMLCKSISDFSVCDVARN